MPKVRAEDGADAGDDYAQGERLGFLLPLNPTDPLEFQGLPEDYPETWIETTNRGETRLKRDYRHLAAELFSVDPGGQVGTGNPAWFLPGKFRSAIASCVSGRFNLRSTDNNSVACARSV
jgi:hypothetical protein